MRAIRFDRQVHPGWFIARLIGLRLRAFDTSDRFLYFTAAVIYRPFREFPAAIISNSVPPGQRLEADLVDRPARYFISSDRRFSLLCLLHVPQELHPRQLGRSMKRVSLVHFELVFGAYHLRVSSVYTDLRIWAMQTEEVSKMYGSLIWIKFPHDNVSKKFGDWVLICW